MRHDLCGYKCNHTAPSSVDQGHAQKESIRNGSSRVNRKMNRHAKGKPRHSSCGLSSSAPSQLVGQRRWVVCSRDMLTLHRNLECLD